MKYANAPKFSWISIPSLETGAITWTMSTTLDLATLDDRRGARYTPASNRLREARSFNEALRISIMPTSNDGPRQISFLIGSSLSDGRLQVNEEIRRRMEKAMRSMPEKDTPKEIPHFKVEFCQVLPKRSWETTE